MQQQHLAWFSIPLDTHTYMYIHIYGVKGIGVGRQVEEI